MSEQYLWDKTGEVDAEVARLEAALRPLAHPNRPLDLGRARPARPTHDWRRVWGPMGLAAAALLFAVWGLWPRASRPSDQWAASAASGPVSIGAKTLDGTAVLAAGDVVETGSGARVRLHAAAVGSLTLGPGTRLRMTQAGGERHWFALERGSLEADISAAPGVFAVDTPAARAIDLGCRYTLDVRADGSGMLRVTLGWVGLKRNGIESLVPAGAMCALNAGAGPGAPYFEGASSAFIGALTLLESNRTDSRPLALAAMLREARPLDAITLWHLLARLPREEAGPVFDRLSALAPPPAATGREAVLAGNQAALDAWWNTLGLGDRAGLRAGMLRAR